MESYFNPLTLSAVLDAAKYAEYAMGMIKRGESVPNAPGWKQARGYIDLAANRLQSSMTNFGAFQNMAMSIIDELQSITKFVDARITVALAHGKYPRDDIESTAVRLQKVIRQIKAMFMKMDHTRGQRSVVKAVNAVIKVAPYYGVRTAKR